MLTKSLFAVALLAALPASADAGSTISDKSYWPDAAGKTVQSRAAISQRDPNSAFADYTRNLEPAMGQTPGASRWHYQGGPKPR
ncbi:conserved exported hypothetical protein [Bradyrhizobium sp. STM 3843]|nr:conserved exported hypothetical protein [Bradyrhizobium sp. STM 3843]